MQTILHSFAFSDLPKRSISTVAPKPSINMEQNPPTPGGDIRLSMDTSNHPPHATYQWFLDGEPLSGSTSDILILSDPSEKKSGKYTCKVVVITECSIDVLVPSPFEDLKETEVRLFSFKKKKKNIFARSSPQIVCFFIGTVTFVSQIIFLDLSVSLT